MIIMGDNEIEEGKVSLRLRNGTEIKGLDVNTFIEMVKGEIASYSLTSAFKDYEG
jgi:threonyl-tRNA synthetase